MKNSQLPSLANISDKVSVAENPSSLISINNNILSIYISNHEKKAPKPASSNALKKSDKTLSAEPNKKDLPSLSKEISSATLPKKRNSLLKLKEGETHSNEISNFENLEKSFFKKYLHNFRRKSTKKIQSKSPQIDKKVPSISNFVEDQQEEEKKTVPQSQTLSLNLLSGMEAASMLISNPESAPSEAEKGKPADFTLKDYCFLQGIIQNERKTLEEEIKNASSLKRAHIGVSLKSSPTKNWEKLRTTMTAFNRIQNLIDQIKNFGTSFAISGLKIKNPIFERKIKSENASFVAVLKPGDRRLIVWEVLLYFSVIYSLIVTPVRCVFFDEELDQYPAWMNLEIFLIAFFSLDIIVTVNTAYFEDHKLVLERRKIILNYLKFWFWIDFLSLFRFELVADFSYSNDVEDLTYLSTFLLGSHLHELLRIFRVRKITILKKIAQKIQDILKIRFAYLKLMSFFLTTLICLHLVSCLWAFLAKIRKFAPDTWVSHLGIPPDATFDLYLASFFWAIETLSTVGYGDIHAVNDLEYFFSIIWLVLGASFYSYTIGSISSVITNSETKKSLLLRQKIIMESFMEENKFSKSLKFKIKKAMEYHSAKSVFSDNEKQEFLSEIPVDMKFEIATSLISNMKTNIPFFAKKDKVFMAHFIPLLTPLSVPKGECLYKKNEYPSLFYILLRGRVNYVTGSAKIVYKTIIEGSYFGEIEIFDNCLRLSTLQAVCNLDLLILPRAEFEQVMKTFPEIEHNMRLIAQEKLRRNKESEKKILPFINIPLKSAFWLKRKTRYQEFKESKKFLTPPLQRKGSLSSFSGYLSGLLRKKTLTGQMSPIGKMSVALKKLSVFGGKKNQTPMNFEGREEEPPLSFSLLTGGNMEIGQYSRVGVLEEEKKLGEIYPMNVNSENNIGNRSKLSAMVLTDRRKSQLRKFRELDAKISSYEKTKGVDIPETSHNIFSERNTQPEQISNTTALPIEKPIWDQRLPSDENESPSKSKTHHNGLKLSPLSKFKEMSRKLNPNMDLSNVIEKSSESSANHSVSKNHIETFSARKIECLGSLRRNLLDLEKKDLDSKIKIVSPSKNLLSQSLNQESVAPVKIPQKSESLVNQTLVEKLIKENREMLDGFEQKMGKLEKTATQLKNLVISLKRKKKPPVLEL